MKFYDKIIIILFFIISVIICGCDSAGSSDSSNSAADISSDYINIVSVSPSPDNLVYGETADITVVVEYNVVTIQEAILNIGFNTQDLYAYEIIDSAKQTVTKEDSQTETGNLSTYTFIVNVEIIDWTSEYGTFKVYVELYNPNTFLTLASDTNVVKI